MSSAARDRLTPNLYQANDSNDDNPVARLEKAFLLVTGAVDVSRKMHAARIHDWREAVKRGVITASEGDRLAAAHDAVAKVVEVDDFAQAELSPIASIHQRHPSDTSARLERSTAAS